MPSPEHYVVITPVPELSSFYYSGILTQGNGQPIPNGSLLTLTLTITDDTSGQVINNRNAIDALNANGVSVDVTSIPPTGALVWEADPADNPLVTKNPDLTDGKYERHTAVLKWTWTTGTRSLAGQRKIYIDVEKYASTETPNEAGSGADTITIALTDPTSGNPNMAAEVWITSDAAGLVRVSGTLTTNDQGKCSFLLTDGATYYLWMRKPGFTPINGMTFVAVKDV